MNTRQKHGINRPEDDIESSAPLMIGFRLDPASRSLLDQKAASQNMSAGELARSYVIEMLHMAEQIDRVGFIITNIWEDVDQLRADLAVSVQTLLVSAGKVDQADAEKWVDNNFRPKCSPSPDQCEAPPAPTTT
jgi:hypothetical protein